MKRLILSGLFFFLITLTACNKAPDLATVLDNYDSYDNVTIEFIENFVTHGEADFTASNITVRLAEPNAYYAVSSGLIHDMDQGWYTVVRSRKGLYDQVTVNGDNEIVLKDLTEEQFNDPRDNFFSMIRIDATAIRLEWFEAEGDMLVLQQAHAQDFIDSQSFLFAENISIIRAQFIVFEAGGFNLSVSYITTEDETSMEVLLTLVVREIGSTKVTFPK